jgi:cytochrome c
MMGMGSDVPSLRNVAPGSQVKTISYCGDTYSVTTADGQTAKFWERNLRFKTDSSEDGPPEGVPAIAGAGMVGDRASVIFASPSEFSQFIKSGC